MLRVCVQMGVIMYMMKAPLLLTVCIPFLAVAFLFRANTWTFLSCLLGLVLLSNRLPVFLRFLFPTVRRGTVGFFHPHSEDGGGGERVLWTAIKALHDARPGLRIAVFTGPGFEAEELVARAERKFNLRIDCPIEIIPLLRVAWLESVRYPRFTLFCQSLVSISVAWMGLLNTVPEIFVDTSGWSFIYPLTKWLGCKVVCYVHYPTISQDMLSRVQSGVSSYNNDPHIAKSRPLTRAKEIYYHAFAACYRFAGSFAEVVMVNSKWTENHIRHIWRQKSRPILVYPPVDAVSLRQLPLERSLEKRIIISVAQFRPEKNHALQIQAYAKCLKNAVDGDPVSSSKLKIVGSCRNQEDNERLRRLKCMVSENHLQSHVEFLENIPYKDLRELLGKAVAGLHTMVDEHFGIGVVEYMAAGVIPIAHNSGGPKLDIISPRHGYLRTTLDEYSDAINEVLRMEETDRRAMAQECRERANLFSQEKFEQEFLNALGPVLPPDAVAPGL